MPRKIEKKVWPEFYEKILLGKKNFELRLADFKCEEGDVLVLKEWDPQKSQYTGRWLEKEVTYMIEIRDANRFWSQEEIEVYGLQVIGFK